jgi:hypothetical protein
MELILDNERVKKNQELIIQPIVQNSKIFATGLIAGAIFSPKIVFAVDSVTADSVKSKATKKLAERVTNAFGCASIIAVCSKASGTTEIAQQATTSIAKHAVQNVDKVATAATRIPLASPQAVAIFACGFTVSWCVKYAIFDK